jgi:hypothetical protein
VSAASRTQAFTAPTQFSRAPRSHHSSYNRRQRFTYIDANRARSRLDTRELLGSAGVRDASFVV